jgi:hypothetical protein
MFDDAAKPTHNSHTIPVNVEYSRLKVQIYEDLTLLADKQIRNIKLPNYALLDSTEKCNTIQWHSLTSEKFHTENLNDLLVATGISLRSLQRKWNLILLISNRIYKNLSHIWIHTFIFLFKGNFFCRVQFETRQITWTSLTRRSLRWLQFVAHAHFEKEVCLKV